MGEGDCILGENCHPPNGVKIEPGGFLTIMGSIYNPTRKRSGLWLNNKGEIVILKDEEGKEVDRCSYKNAKEDALIKCH